MIEFYQDPENYFVNYQDSLRLKNIGFNSKTLKWYPHENLRTDDTNYLKYKEDLEFCYCPIYQQAFDFIYDKWKIYPEFFWDQNLKGFSFTLNEIDIKENELWEIELDRTITDNDKNEIRKIALRKMIDYIEKYYILYSIS